MEFNYEYDPTDNTLKPKPSFLDLYDQTTLINLEANRLFNNRFMYHSLEAGIGARYNKLWLYGGTGDYLNLNDVMVNPSSVDNLMFGIKDVHFPYFGEVKDAFSVFLYNWTRITELRSIHKRLMELETAINFKKKLRKPRKSDVRA